MLAQFPRVQLEYYYSDGVTVMGMPHQVRRLKV